MSTDIALGTDVIILDADCAINLATSGHMGDILKCIGKRARIAIATRVLRRNVPTGDLQPIVDKGLIEIVAPESEAEATTYVNLAVHLDDGSAITLALAAVRSWVMATDDKRVRSFVTEQVPRVQLISTAELIKYWIDSEKPSSDSIGKMLRQIEVGAHYWPTPEHPLYLWWARSREKSGL